MNYPRPPAHVAPYVDALGVEDAVCFLLHFGGAELFIPRHPKGNSELFRVMGLNAALILADLNERTILPRRVPIPKPWLARYLKVTTGLSHAAIARKLHASDVSVRRWIAGMDDRSQPATDQLDLFSPAPRPGPAA